MELPPPFRPRVPVLSTTLPVLTKATSMSAVPSPPPTTMPPVLDSVALVPLRRWPLAPMVSVPLLARVPLVVSASAPPVQRMVLALVRVPAVSVPPDMTKLPAVLVRLLTVSAPPLCSTCGREAKLITASVVAPGTAPPVQRDASAKLPAMSVDHCPAVMVTVPAGTIAPVKLAAVSPSANCSV